MLHKQLSSNPQNEFEDGKNTARIYLLEHGFDPYRDLKEVTQKDLNTTTHADIFRGFIRSSSASEEQLVELIQQVPLSHTHLDHIPQARLYLLSQQAMDAMRSHNTDLLDKLIAKGFDFDPFKASALAFAAAARPIRSINAFQHLFGLGALVPGSHDGRAAINHILHYAFHELHDQRIKALQWLLEIDPDSLQRIDRDALYSAMGSPEILEYLYALGIRLNQYEDTDIFWNAVYISSLRGEDTCKVITTLYKMGLKSVPIPQVWTGIQKLAGNTTDWSPLATLITLGHDKSVIVSALENLKHAILYREKIANFCYDSEITSYLSQTFIDELRNSIRHVTPGLGRPEVLAFYKQHYQIKD